MKKYFVIFAVLVPLFAVVCFKANDNIHNVHSYYCKLEGYTETFLPAKRTFASVSETELRSIEAGRPFYDTTVISSPMHDVENESYTFYVGDNSGIMKAGIVSCTKN